MSAGVRVSVHSDRSGKQWYRLMKPAIKSVGRSSDRDRFLRVGKDEAILLARLDGERTIAEARALAAQEGCALSVEQTESLVLWARREQLFTGAFQNAANQADPSLNRRKASLTWVPVPLLQGGRWLDTLTAATGWVFNFPIACVVGLLWMLACWIAVERLPELGDSLAGLWSPLGWLKLAAVWFVLKVVHEAAHAVSCHKFGGRVGEIGFAWMVVAPVAYVDLTDAYRIRSPWKRIATSLAGIYLELTISAFAIFAWTASESPLWLHFWATVAVTASVGSVLFNLNPLIKLDGYYALIDWLDRPNLATDGQQAFQSAMTWLCLAQTDPHAEQRSTGILLFGTASAFYRLFVIAALLWAAVQWLGIFGMVLAGVLVLALGIPLLGKIYKATGQACLQRPVVLLRLTLIALLLGGGGVGVSWAASFYDPGYPAAIEFVDANPIRTDVEGFVAQVWVQDGQQVAKGDPLLRLENPSLHTRLAAANAEWQAMQAQRRGYQQRHENGLAIAQRKSAEALALQIQDIEKKLTSLTVLAPRDGMVVAAGIEDMVGRWVEQGDGVARVIDTSRIKAIVAIPQTDLPGLSELLGSHLQVRVAGKVVSAELLSVDKHAQLVAPHRSLIASNGGPLAIQMDPHSDQATQLVEPHLKLEVTLLNPPAGLKGGQPARLVRRGER